LPFAIQFNFEHNTGWQKLSLLSFLKNFLLHFPPPPIENRNCQGVKCQIFKRYFSDKGKQMFLKGVIEVTLMKKSVH
jgi:hypothetical protein